MIEGPPPAPPAPPAPPDTPPRLEAKTVPALHGWLWVLHGFSLFRLYPAFWLLLLLFYWTLLLLIGAVPVVGVVVLILTVPGLSAGFMAACHAAQQKTPPLPSHLFMPLRRDQRRQLLLGVAYLACMLVLMAIAQVVGGEVLFSLAPAGMPAGVPAGIPKGMEFELRTGGLVALVLYAPVMLAFWFAPALCYWHGMNVGKALFFSFVAGWRNSGAFLVYGLGWILFMLILPMMAGAVLGAILPRVPQSALIAAAVLVPYMLVVVCAVIMSFYSSFTAVFGVPQVQSTGSSA